MPSIEDIPAIFAETLWPTRCALCDRPGDVLCRECSRSLDFIDYWQTCPACGAQWGRVQCDHCAAEKLLNERRQEPQNGRPPGVGDGRFAAEPHANDERFAETSGGRQGLLAASPRMCRGALRYTRRTATLVKTYKDKGEQRLAARLAALLDAAAPPSWQSWASCITYITATKAARRRRGFDHMELVARELAAAWKLPCVKLLEEPRASDQRAFGRSGRMGNVQGRFRAVPSAPRTRAIVVDDVLTTGATMEDACRALEEAGCACRCLVVARV